MSEKPSEGAEMSFTAEAVANEMRGHVGAVVALSPNTNRKAALNFAARVLGLPFSRVKYLFYGEARRIEAHEADRIRAYLKAAEELFLARGEYEAMRRSFVAAHPALARLAPPEAQRAQVPQDGAAITALSRSARSDPLD